MKRPQTDDRGAVLSHSIVFSAERPTPPNGAVARRSAPGQSEIDGTAMSWLLGEASAWPRPGRRAFINLARTTFHAEDARRCARVMHACFASGTVRASLATRLAGALEDPIGIALGRQRVGTALKNDSYRTNTYAPAKLHSFDGCAP
ncbi:hypothetical protein MRX96_006903 [Rhipicephalus microplus]